MTETHAQHSKFGGSSCERWFNCPASVQLSDGLEQSPTSRAAAEGTAAHELAEMCLKNHWDTKDLMSWEGELIEVEDFNIKVDEEMLEGVWLYRKTIHDDLEKHHIGSVNLKVEEKFHASDLDESAFGTNDCCFVVPGERLIIYDLKYGKGKAVTAKENMQLIFYAIGALQGLSVPESIKTIELVIVQPRIPLGKSFVRRWELSYAELMEYKKEIISKIKEAKSDKPSYNVDPKWCRWCGAKHLCPAQKEGVFTVVRQVEQTSVAGLSVEQMEDIYDKKELIDGYFGELYAQLVKQAKLGVKLKKFKLVDKKDRALWVEEDKAIKYLQSVLGKEAYRESIITITEAKKKLKKAKGDLSELEKFIEKKVSGTKLVKVDNHHNEAKKVVDATFKPVINIDDL